MAGFVRINREKRFGICEGMPGEERRKRLGLAGEKFFFLDDEFLWCHDWLFD